MNKKQPWIAALLNLLLPGLGYLYAGVRYTFGFLLLISSIAAIWVNGWFGTNYAVEPGLELHVQTIAGLLFMIAFAYDAYSETKLLNEKGKGASQE